MGRSDEQQLNSGSRWHRWEPHVHAPGTVLNNQFRGNDAWDKYIGQLERVTPTVRAVGITDYYSTDTYETVLEAKREGRLPACELIFPNIEMRLNVGTIKGGFVNVHLLVSPEDPNHVREIKRFLSLLRFDVGSNSYACTPDDLISLGRKANGALADDRAALEEGSKQFKVDLKALMREFEASQWARDNILIAVAGAMNDGTSGIRDGSDALLRQEIERFAHIIFASSAAQREFWLGRGAASDEQLKADYNGLKPCLHGSDAHDHRKVGVPDGDRFSWIKGALEFDSLRQACIDPAGRAYIGDMPVTAATSSQIIRRVYIAGAPFFQTPHLELNPGLVTIIGARGSGKTALADLIAHACDAMPEEENEKSFLYRAREFLGGAEIKLQWESETVDRRPLDSWNDKPGQYSRARYLTQQFVEDLCSADGLTDGLLREMERVIFAAHGLLDRDGAATFDELREQRVSRFREARIREEDALAKLADRIGAELEKIKAVDALRNQVKQKLDLIRQTTDDRLKLVTRGSEERLKRLDEVNKAAEKIRGHLRFHSQQEQNFLSINDEVVHQRKNRSPEELREIQSRYTATGLVDAEWTNFFLNYQGNVDDLLKVKLQQARKSAADLKGTAPAPLNDVNVSYLPTNADLARTPLALLEAEATRLTKLIGADQETQRKFSALTRKIEEENNLMTALQTKLTDAEGARERRQKLIQDRKDGYGRVFTALLSEQQVLDNLYAPLKTKLATAGTTLEKLAFSVERHVDVQAWAARGERLIDMRKQGAFRGRGSLRDLAVQHLLPAWQSGDAAAAQTAMGKFLDEHQDELLAHSDVPKGETAEYRSWLKDFASWIYGTDHITIQYGINYDGIDIQKLSPGTRGIVLLLLYLALDDFDDRPLIIDQPEENLDPQSIHRELVGLFLSAKQKRQVIMVTHNANLVINTDADQIIIAHCGTHSHGQMPPITYISGGLESADIRKQVCDILEGGEEAFRERARRLRVRLSR